MTEPQQEQHNQTQPFLLEDIPLLDQESTADIQDVTRYSITTAVNNLVRKHTQEIQNSHELYNGYTMNQTRRKLREFFTRNQQTLFQFLEAPIKDVPSVSAYHIIMKRFGRSDISLHKTSLRDLVVQNECAVTLPTLNTSLGFSLETFGTQVNTFLICLKDVTDEIMMAENVLRGHLDEIEKLNANVQTILSLDPTNPAYSFMINATEAYITETMREHKIEEAYEAVITGYKKLVMLQKAIMGIRSTGGAIVTEPLCSVCMVEAIQYTFSPCGHTFCQGCMRKQTLQCFICRQVIRDKIKLYFS